MWPDAAARIRPLLAALGLGLLAGLGTPAGAQGIEDPDNPWREGETVLPTALRTEGLIPIATSSSNLRFGVDPASVTVGADGVNRYVVVATSGSGALNAMQEGVRCNTGEVKVYARYAPGDGWRPVKEPRWQTLFGNAAHRHSLEIARSGLCAGTSASRRIEEILRDLRSPGDRVPRY